MEHRGVCFPPDYVPHGVGLLYDGAPLTLTPAQEEYATFYASVAPDGPQLGNPKTAKIFNRNFWDDFKAALGPDSVVKDFAKCDFTVRGVAALWRGSCPSACVRACAV
jgi:DNA topoisomerase-1